MAGILDPKMRVMDVFLTEEGREHVARGSLNIAYVTFSDAATFYDVDLLSGSSDVANRLFLECSSSPYDQVTFGVDDGGLLRPFKNSGDLSVVNGYVVSGSQFVTGSGFINSANTLLSASLDSFRQNRAIATVDPLFELDSFEVSNDQVTFVVSDSVPIRDVGMRVGNVTTDPGIFQDPRFLHLNNFKYLPPVNRTVGGSDAASLKKNRLAEYARVDSGMSKSDFELELLSDLHDAESLGNVQSIVFDPTTDVNNLHCQVFEIVDRSIRKLDIVDFGMVNGQDPSRVFFLGKVYEDDYGAHTFVGLFSLHFYR